MPRSKASSGFAAANRLARVLAAGAVAVGAFLALGGRPHAQSPWSRAPSCPAAAFVDGTAVKLILLGHKVMNERAQPRWLRDADAQAFAPTPAEDAVLREVLVAMRRIAFGSIHLAIQDGKVVQLETTEKKRL